MTFLRVLTCGSLIGLAWFACAVSFAHADQREPAAPPSSGISRESDTPVVDDLEAFLTALDDDSYSTRRSAAETIIQRGSDPEFTDAVRHRLIRLSRDGSFEQRTAAKELLAKIDHTQSNRRQVSARFQAHAGSDTLAQTLYRRMHDRFSNWISMAESDQLAYETWRQSFPLSNVAPDDHVAWATLLHVEMLLDVPSEPSPRRSKIRMVLGHPVMGPRFSDHSQPFGHQPVLGRLIEAYLRHGDPAADRSLVLAARRYGRSDYLVEQSDRWIQDPNVSASSLATAMLALLAVAPERIDEHLPRLSNDHRVAHVWQSVESGPEKIETRVSDVARVVALHREGKDPRAHGFEHLRADPWLIYAPYSLGTVKRLDSETSVPPRRD